jgi:hypothetical protein
VTAIIPCNMPQMCPKPTRTETLANSDSRTANRPLVGCRSPRSASATSHSWQRFRRCQANGRMGRFAEHESIVASVARSSSRARLASRVWRIAVRGQARAERRSHGLNHRPFAYSEITPILDRSSGPLAWEQRD